VTVVEVCLDDVAGARVAESAGADRIELCAGLAEGGTTPSVGMVEEVLGAVRGIGVNVLVRPRGGDFVLTSEEVGVMRADVRALQRLRADSPVPVGFVIGALTPDGEIDVPVVRTLLEVCGDAPVTFHRAFDATRDLAAALDVLVELGVDRVLTSGGRATALEGADVLAELVERAAGRVTVMAGGSVRHGKVAELVARTRVAEVHLRAAVVVPGQSRHRNPHLPYDTGERSITVPAPILGVRHRLLSPM
jgi:copper homeostasis protein